MYQCGPATTKAAVKFGYQDIYRKACTKLIMCQVSQKKADLPLHDVIWRGDADLEAIRTLVEVEKYSVEDTWNGFTPLYLGAHRGQSANFSLNATMPTQMHGPIVADHFMPLLDMARLNSSNISFHRPRWTSTENGSRPLHVAASNGLVDIVRILISHPGIDVGCKNELGQTALNLVTTPNRAKGTPKSRAEIRSGVE